MTVTTISKYILPPITGAIIGWVTNWAAIKLLFRPHLPINIFGYTLQGLFPKRRKEIARGIAGTIESELLSSKDIASLLDGIEWENEVEKTVEEVIDHRFRQSRISRIPLIGLVSENLVYHVKYLVTKDILAQIEKRKDGLTKKFTDKISVEGMVADRIDALDLMKFEELLTRFIAQELRHIEVIGGVMGFFIGLVQSGFFYFSG
ncbi:MAG: DUF445 family protein [Deltaproteobacteria bacterium]|nr:DUF445 family protein [Deltaproteobacteria bacterium]